MDNKQEQCKGRVPYGTWGRERQCSRKAKKDGYCTQHHPETIKKKDAASRRKFDAEFAERRAAMDKAKRIADADAALFDEVEALFADSVIKPSNPLTLDTPHHPDEWLDPLWQAYKARVEAIE